MVCSEMFRSGTLHFVDVEGKAVLFSQVTVAIASLLLTLLKVLFNNIEGQAFISLVISDSAATSGSSKL